MPTDEKNSVKQLEIGFFGGHFYFSKMWRYLGELQKRKILDIIAEGKGIMKNS